MQKISLTMPVTTYKVFEVTDAEIVLVKFLYNETIYGKIQAIKFMRCQYSIGLKEAKDLCDYIATMET